MTMKTGKNPWVVLHLNAGKYQKKQQYQAELNEIILQIAEKEDYQIDLELGA